MPGRGATRAGPDKGSGLLSRKAIRPTLSPGVNGSNARHIRS
jgi:hypothetical protein